MITGTNLFQIYSFKQKYFYSPMKWISRYILNTIYNVTMKSLLPKESLTKYISENMSQMSLFINLAGPET